MVVSPVIDGQLQWCDGADYFATSDLDEMAERCVRLYKDSELWGRFRSNSLARVARELSPDAFSQAIQSILADVARS